MLLATLVTVVVLMALTLWLSDDNYPGGPLAL